MEHSFDQNYWDEIWEGDRASAMSTSTANPHLIKEVSDLTPGTALEAGCGAGAEAIWLAEHGWQVTGADVAAAALAFAADRADDSGVAEQLDWVQADLSTWEPTTRYDLVTTHYAHPAMPQLDFYERIATWVAPAGTLLIVGHLHHDHASEAQHEHGHKQGHGDQHGHGSDGSADNNKPPVEATATAAAITARLDASIWEVLTAEESHRTMTSSGGRHTQIHDVVVRARRRT
ncbi:class I SAM-dependent methyltransferase [Nocardioides dongkuii]|uniref:class I SAM-dependent methyltransferase n=1 Tax=Nocardioides dongkuii TaxID=2760089 RepID=UPI0018782FBB|nr:class I SAM-dependent methyltransferase [Nocardioides dongkuii]